MVLLLNLIPIILVVIFFALWVAWGLGYLKGRTTSFGMLGLLITAVIWNTVQPSYMPKGEAPRAAVPQFESRDSEVTNRERTHEERDAQELDHQERIEASKEN